MSGDETYCHSFSFGIYLFAGWLFNLLHDFDTVIDQQPNNNSVTCMEQNVNTFICRQSLSIVPLILQRMWFINISVVYRPEMNSRKELQKIKYALSIRLLLVTLT